MAGIFSIIQLIHLYLSFFLYLFSFFLRFVFLSCSRPFLSSHLLVFTKSLAPPPLSLSRALYLSIYLLAFRLVPFITLRLVSHPPVLATFRQSLFPEQPVKHIIRLNWFHIQRLATETTAAIAL